MKTLEQANFTEEQAAWVNTHCGTLVGLINDSDTAWSEADRLAREAAKKAGMDKCSTRVYQVWNGHFGELEGYYMTVGYTEFINLDYRKNPLNLIDNNILVETDF